MGTQLSEQEQIDNQVNLCTMLYGPLKRRAKYFYQTQERSIIDIRTSNIIYDTINKRISRPLEKEILNVKQNIIFVEDNIANVIRVYDKDCQLILNINNKNRIYRISHIKIYNVVDNNNRKTLIVINKGIHKADIAIELDSKTKKLLKIISPVSRCFITDTNIEIVTLKDSKLETLKYKTET